MRRVTLILLAISALFLFLMLERVGWTQLGYYLQKVGYYWPLILVPYGVTNFLVAISWKILLVTGETSPTITRLFFLRLAGESLNQLTPTASLGGEPFKAFRLHADGVAWQEATASLVIQKGLMVLSLVLYILVSLTAVPFILLVKSSHMAAFFLGTLVLGGGGTAFVRLQRSNPCALVIRLMKKFGLCPAILSSREAELSTLDAFLAGFSHAYPGRGKVVFVLLFLSWGLQTVEVYLIFLLLGHPISWGMALCLDGVGMLFTSLGFMIPVSLGVQDGGNILLSLGLRLGATLGAAFSIVRRLREAFWLLLGLLVLAREK
jgi:uncharacterized protein (TIRG00374 family)